MRHSKIIAVSKEFDNLLNAQIEKIIRDCEILGISKRKIPKTKLTKLLTERIYEKKINNGLL